MDRLRADGFLYDPSFASPRDGMASVRRLAERLGELKPDVVRTHPTADAPLWRPFDRPEALGWHSDFTSHVERPTYSLFFIEQADPSGPPWGDWRVARMADIVSILAGSEQGRRAIEVLSSGTKRFEFDEEIFCFPVLSVRDGAHVMRFYADGLRRGCAGQAEANELLAAVTMVEKAADQCCVELHACAGALLIVDNWTTLHYRREQSVGEAAPRRAVLMFAG